MEQDRPTPDSSEAPRASERLDSWKEIAAYLKRDLRTVQRWEKSEALPVHRHWHGKLGSVYAFKVELDAWWNNSHSRIELQEQVVEVQPAESVQLPAAGGVAWRRRLFRAAALAALPLLVCVIAAIFIWRFDVRLPWSLGRRALNFQRRDWVLIANFENRTGESIFDSTLGSVLELELSESQFVSIVPRERVQDTLQLMRKPPETRVNAELGREICLRDGGIRILLTGEIKKVGTGFVLEVRLLEPGTGGILARVTEEATGEYAVLAGMRRIAQRVRGLLGEKVQRARESAGKLEKVTTPSLRALHFYSQAMTFSYQSRWEDAIRALQFALDADPDFASAHILLAHAYSNLDKAQQAAPHYQRAFTLARTTTDRERYFILGSYYERFLKDYEKAAGAYETLVRIYPDHYWAANNLVYAYAALGRWRDRTWQAARLAELRPNDFRLQLWAGQWLFEEGRREETRPFIARARSLITPEIASRYANAIAWLDFLPFYEYWERGDLERAEIELTRIAHTNADRLGSERDHYADYLGLAYLLLGKLGKAEEMFRGLLPSARQHGRLAMLAFARNDQAAMRLHLKKEKHQWFMYAMMMTRCLLRAEAGRLITAINLDPDRYPESYSKGYPKVAQGDLLIYEGHAEEGIALIEDGLRWLPPQGQPEAILGLESLAIAWEQKGNLNEAVRALEKATAYKTRLYPSSGCFWLASQARLAELYRKAGHEDKARQVESDLQKLLARADSHHAIVIKLRQIQSRAALGRSK